MTIPLKKLLDATQAALHLVDDQFLFVWREDGERRYKFVSPAAVRSAVAREPLDSGWIPPTVRRCGSGPRGDWAIAWYPPGKYKLTVLDDRLAAREISVPLPGLVFAGAGKDYYVWAAKGREFAAAAALYHAPLPNVEGGGAICFGSNRVPRASASTIEQAFAIFRDSAFNGHSVTNKSRKHGDDVRNLLFGLAKARTFPEADLISAETSIERVAAALAGRTRR